MKNLATHTHARIAAYSLLLRQTPKKLATHTHARIAAISFGRNRRSRTWQPTLTRELQPWSGTFRTKRPAWQPTLTRELQQWVEAAKAKRLPLATHTHARIAAAKKRKKCGDERTEILLETGQQSLLGGQALKSVPSSFTAAAFEQTRHKWQLGTCPVPLRHCANCLTFSCMLVLRT